ncbi:efflux RND transporter periplasmic adaptor subunit [Phyllobacterium sp. BT25]|uniref:Efflux RND transporter periplasmic adaptor subunit n=1 Tax=Phyllobacterium pellucidum TaxID=2740464 RepID=A0A849VPV2_9HYPH|nr:MULTISPECIES: efflux RND transporter periplasmic adaptor subunit [Phyllobacterium]NTS30120.1 efflux RND transporter periplasmic adaptor subunit [Phyllobacterium pellucidum]UGY11141.1 efflux RND transporter periplasmic adaptor subunit [Phyllobacterium sp. T1018]
MGKKIRILIILIVLAALGVGAWWYWHRPATADALTLYGNVDLRQASLAFNGSERIDQVLVEEGDVVKKGQVLARLDTGRLAPQVREADATVASQRAMVLKLRNGSRPEEIAQARANLTSAKADADNANIQLERRMSLTVNSTISKQELDTTKAAAAVADAKVEVAQSALELAIAGPRAEDLLQAEAQLRGSEAQLALIREQLNDAELIAPVDAVVRSRLMEPGEMAAPMKPVLSLAVIKTKWVRAYVSEPNLGHVKPGMRARITTDSFPDKPQDGWVGFISPVAEFTPKTVETADLRSSLVYEVRVFVDDKDDLLRLGMPATVTLLPNEPLKPLPAGGQETDAKAKS